MIKIFKYKDTQADIQIGDTGVVLAVYSSSMPVKLADAMNAQLKGIDVTSIMATHPGRYLLKIERELDFFNNYWSNGEFINAVAEVISGVEDCDVTITSCTLDD